MKPRTLLAAAGSALAGLVAIAAVPAAAQAPSPYPIAPAPRPYVAPAPAPAPPLMSRRDAIASAFRFCRDQGYRCDLAATELAGDVWLVELRAQRGPIAGPLQVGFDAVTRRIVAVDEPQMAPPPAPPPAPEPRLLAAGEAAAIGAQACAQRGYACRLLSTALAIPLWRLEFDARRPDRAGLMLVQVDARTRAVVRLDEPAPPPPPPTRAMTYEEASRRGLEWCQSHGYACRVENADLQEGRNVWRVKLAALPPRHGHVRLELEATTRVLLDVREHVERREWREHGERGREAREHDREERAERER